MDRDAQDNNSVKNTLRRQAIILGSFVVAIWFLEMVDALVGGQFDMLGIAPRTLSGLRGIVFAPFLHVGFGHVAANTLPFLVLGWFVMLRSVRTFLLVTLITLVVGGLGTWLTGQNGSIHVGASGLIFGYFGYLLLRGYFERSWPAIVWSLLVAVLYGGMLFGILPQSYGVSWQSHLFGFIGGGLAAYWLAERSAHYKTPKEPSHTSF